jgi:hypothetical protein
MPVIGDIEQQFLANLTLNPSVKHRNQWLEVDSVGVLEEKLHVDVLKFHVGIFVGLDDDRYPHPVVTTVRGINEKLGFVDQIAA